MRRAFIIPSLKARRLLAVARSDGLPLVIVTIFGTALFARLPTNLQQDGWLSLVGGREIADHGFSAVDHLTAWTVGAHWVNQQWLAQLLLYGLSALGGLKLVLIVHAALNLLGFSLALIAARSLGGSPRAVAWTAAISMAIVIEGSWQMRAQSFVYVLFVVLLWLLIADSRSSSPSVWWVFPTLILW